jgi:hypothetical protein
MGTMTAALTRMGVDWESEIGDPVTCSCAKVLVHPGRFEEVSGPDKRPATALFGPEVVLAQNRLRVYFSNEQTGWAV